MSQTECVYCRAFGTGDFPKDHVIPRAFGHFKDNLTLDCVCSECNEFFGRELEVFLTRDSIEGLLRVRYGLKTVSGKRQIGRSRLTCRVISSGDWYGARIVIDRDPTGTFINGRPVPQVAFRKFGESDWHWFDEGQLDKPELWERFRLDADTLIAGPSGDETARLREKLTANGVVIKNIGSPERHQGLSQMHAEPMLDDIIFRGVAKIAFNFLAHVLGAGLVLREEFDDVRAYIRRGKLPRFVPVTVARAPVTQGDDGISRRTGGHKIVLWRDRQNPIICEVTLFDHLTYQVALSDGNSLWYPLQDERYFDLDSLRIRRCERN